MILQGAKNKTLTIFIPLQTADPWLAQQHKAIWQPFKCQVWHGDGQYAPPAVQLLQELQNGRKSNSLMIFQSSSLLCLAEHLLIIYEALITSCSGVSAPWKLNKFSENNQRYNSSVLTEIITWIRYTCCSRHMVKLQNNWQCCHTQSHTFRYVIHTMKTFSGSHHEAHATG